jgi:hypothetical protein
MLNLNDIVQLIILCAHYFHPAGLRLSPAFPALASVLAKPVVITALFKIHRIMGARRFFISD